MTIIPPGFHFAPTDQELITFYLSRKAMGLHLPWNPLLEKTIYGETADPWNVFADVPWHTSVSSGEGKECKNVKSVIYVFTKLSKVSGKIRIARTAGCDVYLYGEEYFPRCQKQRDHWIMHEYSLAGVSLNAELPYKDYVICRITRSSKESVRGEFPVRVHVGRINCQMIASWGGKDGLHNPKKLQVKRSRRWIAVRAYWKRDQLITSALLVMITSHGRQILVMRMRHLQQLPMPVDGCLMPQHDQLDGSWLDLLLGLEDGDGSSFDFHLDDEDASAPFFDLSSSQFPHVSFL
ncbi:UNVERIFIED_CONTAM: NAC domain-containing protein 60 [Sesamum latifolium]|uniref:NAC domain-containing protein 60 n=1 Tax=Sesamum latifolium TaxID=2727402 RepID=A0AAW2XZY5_9LAMI